MQRLEVNIQETARHLESDREKIRLWEEEIAGIEPDLEITQAEEEGATESLIMAEEAMQSWQQRWDEFNQTAAGPRQRAEVEQSRIQHLELSLQRLKERIEKAEAERSGLQPDGDEGDIDGLQEQAAVLELEGEALEEKHEQLLPQISDCREQINRLSKSWTSAVAICSVCAGVWRHWKHCNRLRWAMATRCWANCLSATAWTLAVA